MWLVIPLNLECHLLFYAYWLAFTEAFILKEHLLLWFFWCWRAWGYPFCGMFLLICSILSNFWWRLWLHRWKSGYTFTNLTLCFIFHWLVQVLPSRRHRLISTCFLQRWLWRLHGFLDDLWFWLARSLFALLVMDHIDEIIFLNWVFFWLRPIILPLGLLIDPAVEIQVLIGPVISGWVWLDAFLTRWAWFDSAFVRLLLVLVVRQVFVMLSRLWPRVVVLAPVLLVVIMSLWLTVSPSWLVPLVLWLLIGLLAWSWALVGVSSSISLVLVGIFTIDVLDQVS